MVSFQIKYLDQFLIPYALIQTCQNFHWGWALILVKNLSEMKHKISDSLEWFSSEKGLSFWWIFSFILGKKIQVLEEILPWNKIDFYIFTLFLKFWKGEGWTCVLKSHGVTTEILQTVLLPQKQKISIKQPTKMHDYLSIITMTYGCQNLAKKVVR